MMTDYTKRCEGPATYGVLVISICIQLSLLYTYGGDVISRCRMLPTLMSYKDLTQSTWRSQELDAVGWGFCGWLHLNGLLLELSVQRQVRVIMIVIIMWVVMWVIMWVIMWMTVDHISVHMHVVMCNLCRWWIDVISNWHALFNTLDYEKRNHQRWNASN